ncbi:MAG: hypothetical protein QNJ40_21750 [Xanthomonadales bacterium]|nr:hypothetical protein [Xanthomonadales bacterium]
MRLTEAAAWTVLGLALLGQALAHPGTGLVVSNDGSVFVADPERNRVWEIVDGRSRVVVRGKHAHLLGFDRDGTLLGEHVQFQGDDRWEGHLWRLGPDGKVGIVAGPGGDAFGPEFSPLMDAAGRRYAWDGNVRLKLQSRIVRWTGNGTELVAGSRWGQLDGRGAAARFGSVGGMDVSRDGSIVVADGECVRSVSAQGEVKTLACGGLLKKPRFSLARDRSNHLRGITSDGQNVYVANHLAGSVVRVDPNGALSLWLEKRQGWSALGLKWTGGRLYVLERKSSRLRVSVSERARQSRVLVELPHD